MATPRHIKREHLLHLMDCARTTETNALQYLRMAVDAMERLSEGGTKAVTRAELYEALREWGTSRFNHVIYALKRSGHLADKEIDARRDITGWILTP